MDSKETEANVNKGGTEGRKEKREGGGKTGDGVLNVHHARLFSSPSQEEDDLEPPASLEGTTAVSHCPLWTTAELLLSVQFKQLVIVISYRFCKIIITIIIMKIIVKIIMKIKIIIMIIIIIK